MCLQCSARPVDGRAGVSAAFVKKLHGQSFAVQAADASACHVQVLYYAIGKQLMLQPDAGLTFVRGEGYHPLFPPETGLFIVEVRASTCICYKQDTTSCSLRPSVNGIRSH